MSWIAALTSGVGLGLASFGGLWLTVRWGTASSYSVAVFLISSLIRLLAVAVVFCVLSCEGPGPALAGLGGLLTARGLLVGGLGGMSHGGT
jgi:F1F0 ATPase subunit 2